MYVRVHVHMYVCMYLGVYVCVCAYVCVYLCMYAHAPQGSVFLDWHKQTIRHNPRRAATHTQTQRTLYNQAQMRTVIHPATTTPPKYTHTCTRTDSKPTEY